MQILQAFDDCRKQIKWHFNIYKIGVSIGCGIKIMTTEQYRYFTFAYKFTKLK